MFLDYRFHRHDIKSSFFGGRGVVVIVGGAKAPQAPPWGRRYPSGSFSVAI